MNIVKALRPVSLALPGLLAVSSWGAWKPFWSGAGAGFSSAADVTGFTTAKYSGATSINAHKTIQDYDRVLGWQTPVNNVAVSGTLITVSSTWSENTYSYGECYLQRDGTGDNGDAYVSSSI